jgi:hypothetical protein
MEKLHYVLYGRERHFNDTDLVRVMLEATFCVHPPGDSLSRKGIIDSIVLGQCLRLTLSHLQSIARLTSREVVTQHSLQQLTWSLTTSSV